jgi:hypothetical protein
VGWLTSSPGRGVEFEAAFAEASAIGCIVEAPVDAIGGGAIGCAAEGADGNTPDDGTVNPVAKGTSDAPGDALGGGAVDCAAEGIDDTPGDTLGGDAVDGTDGLASTFCGLGLRRSTEYIVSTNLRHII